MRKIVLLSTLLVWVTFLAACNTKKPVVGIETWEPDTASVGLVITDNPEENSDSASVWLTVTDAPQDNDSNDTVLEVQPSN